jgi:Sec-independent protein translocase protein TatA
MGDVAKGIKSFKKGMADDAPDAPAETAKTIDHTETPVASQPAEKKDKV